MSPALEPPMSACAEPYWEATRRQELHLQWCEQCRAHVWFPRVACPRCLTPELTWRQASGRGRVYASTVQQRRTAEGETDELVIALVDLAEGVRVLSRLVDVDGGTDVFGADVEARWEPMSDGRHLVVFALADQSAPTG